MADAAGVAQTAVDPVRSGDQQAAQHDETDTQVPTLMGFRNTAGGEHRKADGQDNQSATAAMLTKTEAETTDAERQG